MLEYLLETVFNKYDAGTVILIDEHDAPMTNHIMERDISDVN
jgi:hypothetical protein